MKSQVSEEFLFTYHNFVFVVQSELYTQQEPVDEIAIYIDTVAVMIMITLSYNMFSNVYVLSLPIIAQWESNKE